MCIACWCVYVFASACLTVLCSSNDIGSWQGFMSPRLHSEGLGSLPRLGCRANGPSHWIGKQNSRKGRRMGLQWDKGGERAMMRGWRKGEERRAQPDMFVQGERRSVRAKVAGHQGIWGWRGTNWGQIVAWVEAELCGMGDERAWGGVRKWRTSEWWLRSDEEDRRSPEDIEAGNRIGLADIHAGGRPGGWQGGIVNEAEGRQRDGGQRGQFGWVRRGWATRSFGLYDWEMMGILPKPAKQSVMFSLTTGDCQQGGAAGSQSV